jgi:hypothetical protein
MAKNKNDKINVTVTHTITEATPFTIDIPSYQLFASYTHKGTIKKILIGTLYKESVTFLEPRCDNSYSFNGKVYPRDRVTEFTETVTIKKLYLDALMNTVNIPKVDIYNPKIGQFVPNAEFIEGFKESRIKEFLNYVEIVKDGKVYAEWARFAELNLEKDECESVVNSEFIFEENTVTCTKEGFNVKVSFN